MLRTLNIQGVTDAHRGKRLCARLKAGIEVLFDVANMACFVNLHCNADRIHLLKLLNRVDSGQKMK